MPNHSHLIVVPDSEDGLRRGIGEAHRRCTRRVNFRKGWRGHLEQRKGSGYSDLRRRRTTTKSSPPPFPAFPPLVELVLSYATPTAGCIAGPGDQAAFALEAM